MSRQLMMMARTIHKDTLTTAITLPSGSSATYPATTYSSLLSTVPFGTNAKSVGPSSGSPAAYVPGATSGFESVSLPIENHQKLVVGLTAGLIVPAVIAGIAAFWYVSWSCWWSQLCPCPRMANQFALDQGISCSGARGTRLPVDLHGSTLPDNMMAVHLSTRKSHTACKLQRPHKWLTILRRRILALTLYPLMVVAYRCCHTGGLCRNRPPATCSGCGNTGGFLSSPYKHPTSRCLQNQVSKMSVSFMIIWLGYTIIPGND